MGLEVLIKMNGPFIAIGQNDRPKVISSVSIPVGTEMKCWLYLTHKECEIGFNAKLMGIFNFVLQ